MAMLRNGCSAVDAVEIAIKILEDREITNAGYGSNLSMDGVVECDAVVVDQFGRSGGAGAVARTPVYTPNGWILFTDTISEVKNPISLARMLLDHTTRTLSLRRVPPNLLVGQGATDFAYENHMPVLPLDVLVSPAAGDRWRRWKSDLVKAEQHKRRDEAERYGMSPVTSEQDLLSYMEEHHDQEGLRRKHTQSMMVGMPYDTQPLSPPQSDDRQEMDRGYVPLSYAASSLSSSKYETPYSTPGPPEESFDPEGPPGMGMGMLADPSRSPFANSTVQMMPTSGSGDLRHQGRADGGLYMHDNNGSAMDLSDLGGADHELLGHTSQSSHTLDWHDAPSGSESDSTTTATHGGFCPVDSSLRGEGARRDHPCSTSSWTTERQPHAPYSSKDSARASPNNQLPLHDGAQIDEDIVTDTVGAVAIDQYGNIACGASSGGIGMKHRGRIGPAALVGIGAAVIPIEADDPDRTCVATVTSGTGEHMGTTGAAGVCSERLYHGLRKGPGGRYQEADDDEAIRSFIERDFMGHPSVKQSHSSGAIGILSVKKTNDGAILYFGHNTDSFALASMHADEQKPVCTMSRSKGNGVIAQGGRMIRFRRR